VLAIFPAFLSPVAKRISKRHLPNSSLCFMDTLKMCRKILFFGLPVSEADAKYTRLHFDSSFGVFGYQQL